LIGTGAPSFAQQYGYNPQSTAPPSLGASIPQTSSGQLGPQSAVANSAQAPQFQSPSRASTTPQAELQKQSAALPSPGDASVSSRGTFTNVAPSPSTGSSQTTIVANGANKLTNLYQSNPAGQTLVDTLAAAGGAVKGVPGLVALGHVDEAISLTTLIQQKNYAAIPANLTSYIGSNLAGAAPGLIWSSAPIYAAPLASATFVASFELGQHYVAPIVAPAAGNFLFNLSPTYWTSAATAPHITVIPTISWTGVQPSTAFPSPVPVP
jgi:hypothetical protein